jgi:hypothetical protein
MGQASRSSPPYKYLAYKVRTIRQRSKHRKSVSTIQLYANTPMYEKTTKEKKLQSTNQLYWASVTPVQGASGGNCRMVTILRTGSQKAISQISRW